MLPERPYKPGVAGSKPAPPTNKIRFGAKSNLCSPSAGPDRARIRMLLFVWTKF